MSNNTLYVTHYIPDRYPKVGLRSVEFITTLDQGKPKTFYSGFDMATRFSESDLALEIEHGGIVKLASPSEIHPPGEGVWTDKNKVVWIGNYDNPFAGKNLRKV